METEVTVMAYWDYTPEEISERGRQIYEHGIRQKVEPGNKGKFVVINVETGEYGLSDDHWGTLEISSRFQNEHLNSAVYTLRIGYRAASTMY